jgi:DNA-binding response OmpR family regulator/EAL domain-containing protein (putative c-di-GMP-specific phosphodiesterase class I)
MGESEVTGSRGYSARRANAKRDFRGGMASGYSSRMSDTSPAPAQRESSTGDRALRQRTQAFVRDWRASIGRQWQVEQAGALYEELERLAELADAQGDADVADPVLELTAYLCSFVDRNSKPNPAQLQGLETLIERLADASGDKTARNPRKPAVAVESAHRQVFYLRESAHEIPGLAALLGQQGAVVRPFLDRASLLRALDEVSPDVVLVGEKFEADINAVMEAVQRLRPAHREPPLCLLLASQTDPTRTLFVQRAGADAVVVERDPIALSAQIDGLLAQRRALGYRVLIVEDDRSQAKFCESILRHRGMLTHVCEDSSAVPAALSDFKPDLVLLDLYLPGSNGIEIAQRIRESGHAFLPIVFLSGELDLDLRFDAIRMGADDFITKPIKPRHLVTAVESRIRRTRELAAAQVDRRGERRGNLSGRDVLAAEVMRAAREESERCPALALFAVDDVESVLRSSGFVASSTLSQQLAGVLAAELHGERSLCAWGELRFLVLLHADDQLALREQLEALRRKLEERPWLSEQSPVHLHVSLGCARLQPQLAGIEDALERVRSLLANAQAAGGARCEFDLREAGPQAGEDPQVRLVRALLRAPSVRGTAHFEFQPFVPLAGQIAGQYEARMALKPPKSRQVKLLQREEWLPIARELELVAHADRHFLRGVIERVRERHVQGQDLRLYLPIAASSLFDPAFAPWLAAEFGAQAVPSNTLALEFDAADVRAELPRLRGMLEPVQRVGVRLALTAGSGFEADLGKLLALDAFGVIKFARAGAADAKPEAAWEPWSKAIAEARSLGKIVVASDVAGMADIGVLLRLGVHYAQGEALSGWLAEWDFDFAEAVL